MITNATNSSSADTWHPARLIPVAGIRGQEEQERRATSALLAVMLAVPEFGHALLNGVGSPKGRISAFTEIQLKDGDGKLSIPDGALVVERGKTHWRALVEVKTGAAALGAEQVTRYLDMARDHSFDAVVTISNQITANPVDLPYPVDRRKIKRVGLYHLSWWRIITEAVLQHRFRGVSDPDQAWILGELIAYLDHENSGASGFEDMGSGWVAVRDAARQGTLRAGDKEVRAVAANWEQFLDYLALGLSQDLGREVSPLRPRGKTPDERIDGIVHALAGGNLLRQIPEAPADLRVEVAFANTRETSAALLRDARQYPQHLLSSSDPKREPRAFTLAMTRKMGLKGGKGQGSFVRETRRQAIDFYGEIVQNLKAWQARAPKLPDAPSDVPLTSQEEPPPFVAIDERDVGEAVLPWERSAAEAP